MSYSYLKEIGVTPLWPPRLIHILMIITSIAGFIILSPKDKNPTEQLSIKEYISKYQGIQEGLDGDRFYQPMSPLKDGSCSKSELYSISETERIVNWIKTFEESQYAAVSHWGYWKFKGQVIGIVLSVRFSMVDLNQS